MSRRRFYLSPTYQSDAPATSVYDLPLIEEQERPGSISTVAYGESAAEVFLTIATARRVYPNIPILIYCEPGLFERFRKTGLPTRGLRFFPHISKSSLQRRAKFVERFSQDGFWSAAVISFKMDAVQAAVARFGSTLFVDSDVLFMRDVLTPHVKQVSIGLSPHYSGDAKFEGKVGNCNAGLLYVRNPQFPVWWRRAFYTDSQFFEQSCLDRASTVFKAARFPFQHNVGVWADPERWELASTLHVHMYRPRRKAHQVFHPERAEELSKYAENRLSEQGFASLLEGVNNGSF